MCEKVSLLAGKRQGRESLRAVQACNDYLRLGPRRSLRALTTTQTRGDAAAPKARLGTLERWSACYGWQARAEEYDARLEAEKNVRAKEIMQTGLASTQGRVDALMELAEFLDAQVLAQVAEKGCRMMKPRDGRLLGVDAVIEQVRLERVDAALVKQYLGVLDDLLKETGKRVPRATRASDDNQTCRPCNVEAAVGVR